ncbi:AAA family ATPase [Chitinophaga sp. LS1]|uniref:AAA family ATPase n=1 Tax=Chitinophaga sp. LS1 TaxID=3051176 RepID=UPI002AABBE71|nr:AAA family ATPase [Chitinophaga sp. LS1]WPV66519.1 AAA family ATPase [Chitinophaga sp. LS1]
MAGSTHKLSDQVSFYSKTSLKSMYRLAQEAVNLEELRLLFGHYIPENCLIHFPLPRGTGKSWFCMQLCIAIAAEWPSFLGEAITLHGNTLYINNELSEKSVQRRSKKLLDNAPLPLGEQYKAMVYTSRRNMLDDLHNIVTIIERVKPVLIIIDNLRMAFTDVDTNNNKEITKLMFTLLALCEGTQTSVLVTDHFRKHTNSLLSESDLQAGSGIKTDLSDGDFFLRKSGQDKGLRILKRGKSRHFEEEDNAKLIRLRPDSCWFELVYEGVNEAEHVGIRSLKDKDEQKDLAKALRSQDKSLDEIAHILGKGSSRQKEFHLKPLTKPCLSVAAYTAFIILNLTLSHQTANEPLNKVFDLRSFLSSL